MRTSAEDSEWTVQAARILPAVMADDLICEENVFAPCPAADVVDDVRRVVDDADVVQPARQALGHDVAGWDHLPRLDLTARVVREALRLYPPAWALPRICTRPKLTPRAAASSSSTIVTSSRAAARASASETRRESSRSRGDCAARSR